MTEAVSLPSLEYDFARLTHSELARCEPVYSSSLCLSRQLVRGRLQAPESARVEEQGSGCKDNIHDIGYIADNTICSFVLILAIYNPDCLTSPVTPNPDVHATSPLVSLKQPACSHYC